MTIEIGFNEKSQQFLILQDDVLLDKQHKAFLNHTGKDITQDKLQAAYEKFFEAPANTEFDIIQDKQRRQQAVYSELGLF